jgi:hypothetical protein
MFFITEFYPVVEQFFVLGQHISHVFLFEKVNDFANLEVFEASNDSANFDNPEKVFHVTS